MRVLVVEDDARIARDLIAALSAAGYVTDHVADGEEAWFKGDIEDYAAAVLDLGLPGMSGLSVLRRWRENGRTFPILILTARGSWRDRVEGIDVGADDYLPKPFRMEEVLARLRAIIRRSAGRGAPILRSGNVTIDPRRKQVDVNGVPKRLSPQEYRLVHYLMLNAGRVVSQMELAEQLHGRDDARDTNAVQVLVGRVRRKLGTNLIKTRRGFGYAVDEDQPA